MALSDLARFCICLCRARPVVFQTSVGLIWGFPGVIDLERRRLFAHVPATLMQFIHCSCSLGARNTPK